MNMAIVVYMQARSLVILKTSANQTKFTGQNMELVAAIPIVAGIYVAPPLHRPIA